MRKIALKTSYDMLLVFDDPTGAVAVALMSARYFRRNGYGKDRTMEELKDETLDVEFIGEDAFEVTAEESARIRALVDERDTANKERYKAQQKANEMVKALAAYGETTEEGDHDQPDGMVK